jgi:hypothetical protein
MTSVWVLSKYDYHDRSENYVMGVYKKKSTAMKECMKIIDSFFDDRDDAKKIFSEFYNEGMTMIELKKQIKTHMRDNYCIESDHFQFDLSQRDLE